MGKRNRPALYAQTSLRAPHFQWHQNCSMYQCVCRAELSKAMVAAAARYSSHIAVTEAERLTPVIEALSNRCAPLTKLQQHCSETRNCYAVAKGACRSESRLLDQQHARLTHKQQ